MPSPRSSTPHLPDAFPAFDAYPTEPTTPAPGELDGWITPPTDGGERLDGHSLHLLTADRVLTGRRGDAPGSLEVIGEVPTAASASAADLAAARSAGRGGAVLTAGGRILAVGTAIELAARLDRLAEAAGSTAAQVRRIDLPGCTLLPGLIETHAHLASSDTDVEYPAYGPHEVARLTLNAARSARHLLSVGVTSVQSLGARHYVDVALRDAIEAGELRGPRVRASGPQITTTAGHAWYHRAEVDGPDDIRREVRTHHKMGVDTIKAMATGGFTTGGSTPWNAQFSLEELTILFDDAHRLGRWTAAHAHGVTGIERAVRAGVDYLAHASFISEAGRSVWDPRLGALMAEAGVYVDCTITPDIPRMLQRDDSFAPPVRLLWEHGVRIVAGRDSGIPGVPQRGYVGGLEAMEWVGLPRAEVLLAATSRAAAAIGCAGVTGSWPRTSRPTSSPSPETRAKGWALCATCAWSWPPGASSCPTPWPGWRHGAWIPTSPSTCPVTTAPPWMAAPPSSWRSGARASSAPPATPRSDPTRPEIGTYGTPRSGLMAPRVR
ncbi:MAG: amidohydrolase family protein [Actinomyces sp.]|uniref:amidohydrolase family protein n=1 Tax=Actinomyces sp. TaxID=29317 RepID=UPI0026DC4BBD|nr:amidohydrolase family protein [Actinomyces sp.]MDO4242835.1 amidohydrolase family protein [Actinomyces sp.]